MLHLAALWVGTAFAIPGDDVVELALPGIRTDTAGDAATSSSPGGGTGSFDAVLSDAKARYFQGEPDLAKELLQGLLIRLYAGEEPDWKLVVEALTYLG